MTDKIIQFPAHTKYISTTTIKPRYITISIDKDVTYLIEYKGKTYSLNSLLEKLINLSEGNTYA